MACTVKANRHGTLAFRIHWNGREWWEGLGLPDTKANRAKVQRIADAISAEIRATMFTPERYLHYFPHGNRAPEFDPLGAQSAPAVAGTRTIREYAALWLPRQRPPFVREAQRRDYERDINRCVLVTRIVDERGERAIGDILVAELAPKHLLQLRDRLTARPLALKTVRNIIDGSFRAMMRDARTVDLLIATDTFSALSWPRVSTPLPDPFTAMERDQLLEWFLRHRRFYHPFVATLFFTGLRPSEAVALRWGDVDTTAGTVCVARSRYLGTEAAPKTPKSRRVIRVTPTVVEVLRAVRPLRVDPDGYVFTNAKNGGPIDQSEWPKDHWRRALSVTKIRPRKFYATRHTFISVALTAGVNLKWLAEYCGTSVAMIERSYGRFLAECSEGQLALLDGCAPGVQSPIRRSNRASKPETLCPRSRVCA